MRQSIEISLNKNRPIPPRALRTLYDSEPWWPERSLEDMEFVLSGYPAIGAWDDDRLIGFARAVTDGRFRAYVEDVLVLEEYRSDGIGRKILERLLRELEEIHVVTLFCRPRLSDYYQSLGFKEFTKQVVMHKRNVR